MEKCEVIEKINEEIAGLAWSDEGVAKIGQKEIEVSAEGSDVKERTSLHVRVTDANCVIITVQRYSTNIRRTHKLFSERSSYDKAAGVASEHHFIKLVEDSKKYFIGKKLVPTTKEIAR